MAHASNSRLDESWVVEDQGDESISWDEHSAASDIDEEQKATFQNIQNPETTRVIRERRKSPRLSTPTSPEPEFIMPSWRTTITPSEQIVRMAKPPTTTKVAQSKKQRTLVRSGRSNQTQAPAPMASPVVDKIVLVLVHATEWSLDVLGQTLKTLKRPISWLLAAYLFFGILMLVQNLLTTSVYTALSPICRIPGVSLLNLPLCQFTSLHNDKPTLPASASAPVEFDALMKTQSHFEEIMSESAAGVSLPLDMKRSETSIRDLRQIVRYSQLASRNEMVLEFDGFIETARIASYDLQKFNSHVGRGVDIVLSTARWTQRVLDDMAVKQSSRGIIPGFIQDKLLAPFKPIQFTEARLLDQYISHTRIVSEEIERLIEEAQALLLVLQNLEDRLDVIHAIALRDNVSAQASKDEILSHLWTLLGGNRAKLGKYNNQLTLLRQVGQYRKVAWAHVSATILKLQAMGAELEELRTRVSSAEVLRGHKEIPLAVHVENIRLGVQRLEEGRENARRLEQGHVRRVMEGAEQGNVMALGQT